MYRTTGSVIEPSTGPGRDRAGATIPLPLTRVVRREFTGGTAPTDAPVVHRHYADLAALHGIEHHPDVLVASSGTTFGTMAAAVLADVLPPGAPVDLVVLAHVLPDLDPRYSPGARLSGAVAGAPLVFAVSGTDASVAFTALRAAGAYVRRHGYRRVVVLVLDQATLPYRSSAEPAGDAAVALLLEQGAGAEVTVGRIPDVAPHDVGPVLGRTAIGSTADRVVHVGEPGGFPATGIWAGLDPRGHTALVHHAHGDLHFCTVRGS